MHFFREEIGILVAMDNCKFFNFNRFSVDLLCVIGLQINDIEPFCQDEIALYKQCAEKRVSFHVELFVQCIFIL